MPDRRTTLALGVGLLTAAALPARAQAPANAMPAALRRDLESGPGAVLIRHPGGDVTLTQFVDYNCQYCRKMVPTIRQLGDADPNLRIIVRDWPVFGEGSEFGARAALAAVPMGKYLPFHDALMATPGRVQEASVLRAARAVGLDPDRLRTDMDAPWVFEAIERSFELADHMQLVGTPTYLAGNEALFGENGFAQMQGLIDRARATMAD